MADKEVSNETLQHDIQNLCSKFDKFVSTSELWRNGIDDRLRHVELELAKHQASHNGKNGWRAVFSKFYAPITVAVVVWLLVEVLPRVLRVIEP